MTLYIVVDIDREVFKTLITHQTFCRDYQKVVKCSQSLCGTHWLAVASFTVVFSPFMVNVIVQYEVGSGASPHISMTTFIT